MKLCRFGKNGYEKPGIIDSQGTLRDLSGVISNIDQETISPKGLAKLRKIRPESLPLVKTEPRFGVPYTGISKFIAIGLNYKLHAEEAGSAGTARADHFQQVHDLHQRPERRHHHPAQFDQARLRSGAWHRDRHQGPVCA